MGNSGSRGTARQPPPKHVKPGLESGQPKLDSPLPAWHETPPSLFGSERERLDVLIGCISAGRPVCELVMSYAGLGRPLVIATDRIYFRSGIIPPLHHLHRQHIRHHQPRHHHHHHQKPQEILVPLSHIVTCREMQSAASVNTYQMTPPPPAAAQATTYSFSVRIHGKS